MPPPRFQPPSASRIFYRGTMISALLLGVYIGRPLDAIAVVLALLLFEDVFS